MLQERYIILFRAVATGPLDQRLQVMKNQECYCIRMITSVLSVKRYTTWYFLKQFQLHVEKLSTLHPLQQRFHTIRLWTNRSREKGITKENIFRHGRRNKFRLFKPGMFQ